MIIRRNLNIEGLEATIAISLNGSNFPGVRRLELLSRLHGVGVPLCALAFQSAAAAHEVRPGRGACTEAARGGIECVITGRSRWWSNAYKNNYAIPSYKTQQNKYIT